MDRCIRSPRSELRSLGRLLRLALALLALFLFLRVAAGGPRPSLLLWGFLFAAVYAAKQSFGPVVRTGACLLQLVGHRGRIGRLGLKGYISTLHALRALRVLIASCAIAHIASESWHVAAHVVFFFVVGSEIRHVVLTIHIHVAHARVLHGFHHALHLDFFLCLFHKCWAGGAVLGQGGGFLEARAAAVVGVAQERRQRCTFHGGVGEDCLGDVGVAVANDVVACALHGLALRPALAKRAAHVLHLKHVALLHEIVFDEPLALNGFHVTHFFHLALHVCLRQRSALGIAEGAGLTVEVLGYFLAHLTLYILQVGFDRAHHLLVLLPARVGAGGAGRE
mmetsp:Transcript_35548/g.57127  ORF Transcript_35548/g.57127 Transcript_35548/m.57127 type:complete len:337 (+) Transcript_35548:144-1154(+)